MNNPQPKRRYRLMSPDGCLRIVRAGSRSGTLLCGRDALEGASRESTLPFLLDAFYSSAQTFATIG